MGVLKDLAAAWRDDIRQLEVDDYIMGGDGGVDNEPHRQLAERTLWLRDRQDATAATVAEQAARLGLLEANGSTATADALRLSWALSDRGFDFELFVVGHSWRDIEPIGGVATVAGDDSVDLSTTAGLLPGQSYVIHQDGVVAAEITVSQVLSATRLRATAPIAVTLAGATLARTSWTIGADGAVAGDGGVLYSHPLTVLRYQNDGRIVIRRDAGDGLLTVGYRVSGAGAWTDARLLSTTERDAGTRDEEWAIGGGVIELRIGAAHGESGADPRVRFLAALTAPGAGAATAVRQPRAVDPAAGAVGVGETPTLTGSTYQSLYGLAHGGAEFRIASDADMQQLVHTAVLAGPVTSHAVPAGTLTTGQSYWWDVLYKDAEGVASPRSTPAGFATAATFQYIVKPVAQAPAPGATAVTLTPTLQSSAFSVHGGADTLTATRWRLYDASASLVHEATLTPPTAPLTSYAVPTGVLAADTGYTWTVEHQGQALGWSAPSLAAGFHTQRLPAAPTLLAPADGAVGVSPMPTLQISAFYVSGGGTDVHVASQYVVTLPDGTVVHDSGAVAALTSYTVPAGLAGVTAYQWKARHQGQALGWGPWSAPTTFTTAAPAGEQTFTASGTFTVPAGVTSVCVVCVGGGGGTQGNGGGGGGGLRWKNDIAVMPGQQIPVTVGAAGAGALAPSGTATAGGSSSFGAVVTAYGGGVGTQLGGNGGGGVGGDGGGNGGDGRPYDGSTGSGGGGAGGYTGNGGKGGSAAAGATSGSGGGGGGGGTYSGVGGDARAGAGGGGVGLLGAGPHGAAGGASGGGGGGSGGGNGFGATGSTGGGGGAYGGGGGGDGGDRDVGGSGGGGAVRVIWGAGRGFPNNAA